MRHQIRTVFALAVTDDREQDILRQWDELKHTHEQGLANFETFQKYRALKDELDDRRIFIKTLPKFVLELKYCGYTPEDIEKEIHYDLPNNPYIAGYGNQVTVLRGYPKAYTFQPYVIFPEDLETRIVVWEGLAGGGNLPMSLSLKQHQAMHIRIRQYRRIHQ